MTSNPYPTKWCVWCCKPGHQSHACILPRPAPQKAEQPQEAKR